MHLKGYWSSGAMLFPERIDDILWGPIPRLITLERPTEVTPSRTAHERRSTRQHDLTVAEVGCWVEEAERKPSLATCGCYV